LLINELGQFEQVVRALDQCAPGVDLVAQALRLAQDLLRGTLVGPEVGCAGTGVELVDARLLGV
jgi:hypothetical protein